MKQKLHRNNDTIFRVDTHSDLNPVMNSASLPKLYRNYVNTNDEDFVSQAQELVWDIGAAKSSVLFATGIKDLIWGIPSWVPDKQVGIDYFLRHGKKNITLGTTKNLSKIKNMEDFSSYTNHITSNTKIKQFHKVQTGTLTKKGLKTIVNAISKNGPTYVLDIDLDYFVCNGKAFDSSYWKDSYDLQSYHRTKFQEVNENLPRNKNEKSKLYLKYEQSLQREIKEIKKRINQFLKIIKYLHKKGYNPSRISICDSTNILFEACSSCNSISNGYVPTHLALFVHITLEKGLKKVFQ
jgi:hypothetical protein